jgi:hypothetical protein
MSASSSIRRTENVFCLVSVSSGSSTACMTYDEYQPI